MALPSPDELKRFSEIVEGPSEEINEKRNDFFDEISKAESGGNEKRATFAYFLYSGTTSKLFEAADDETAERLMTAFEPDLWKINSRNNLNQNLLQFFITSRFKSSLQYLLQHPSPQVKEMLFERDGAGKTPLEVSIKTQTHFKQDKTVAVTIWEEMKKTGWKRIKEHFENYDKEILHICAAHGQDDILLQIAQMIEKSDILLRRNEEERTVFELCNNQKIVVQLLQRLSAQTKMEDALKDLKDNKKKNLLHHWAAKNFDDAIDFFRRSVSRSVFTDMLFEESANGSTPLMVSALNGTQECLEIFLHFLSLEMKEWTPGLKKKRMDMILHHHNNYNNTLLALVLKQNEILQVSKHILLGWEKINHKEIHGRNLTDQEQRQAVTQCMKKNLKPSVEVQMALSDVNDSLQKNKTKIVSIWIKVFLKTLLIPVAMLLLDAFPDFALVESYYEDWTGTVNERSLRDLDFDPCTNKTLEDNHPFVCYPDELDKTPKFFYALAFVISPWFFYFFEYLHSDHCVNFEKVR